MSQQPPTPVPVIPIADHELARRVLRWLALGGVVLGAAQVVATAGQLLAWGTRFFAPHDRVIVNALYRTTAVVTVLAPTILIGGSLGLLSDRRWARPTLTVYAFLQIAGALGAVAVALIFAFTTGASWTIAQQIVWPVTRMEEMLLHCLYPVAILLCLVRPGLTPTATPAAASFPVLPQSAPAQAPPGA